MNICEYLSPTPIKHIVLCGLKKFEKALFYFFFKKMILKCILRIEKEEEKERET